MKACVIEATPEALHLGHGPMRAVEVEVREAAVGANTALVPFGGILGPDGPIWLGAGDGVGAVPLSGEEVYGLCLPQPDGAFHLYHRLETDARSAYYLRIGTAPAGPVEALCAAFKSAAETHRLTFCGRRMRKKWRADVEMERKYVFGLEHAGDMGAPPPVDIWTLSRRFHGQALGGAWPGWIQEVNEEFHVYTYDSAIFEVTDPPPSQGYIAFIGQPDGNATIKYKRFVEDAEIRFEHLSHHHKVMPADYAAEARRRSKGTVKPLPGFRRVRFDVDFESLETGNAYTVVIDVSRPLPKSRGGYMAQCEVEYIRTRSVNDPVRVMEEFEQICAHAEATFRAAGLRYEQVPYSKLSFMRDVADRQACDVGSEVA